MASVRDDSWLRDVHVDTDRFAAFYRAHVTR